MEEAEMRVGGGGSGWGVGRGIMVIYMEQDP
jgi:hypothetical protein